MPPINLMILAHREMRGVPLWTLLAGAFCWW